MKKIKKSVSKKAQVSVVMGSRSDLSTMEDAAKVLKEFGVPFEMKILSAHRTPAEVADFADKARSRGLRVIIAGAGGAAHLPGMIAAVTELPVIGVPVSIGPLEGLDALLSIVQMPRGIPVATVAIGNAWNAGILALQIIGVSLDTAKLRKVFNYKKTLRKKVLADAKKI